MAAWAVISGDKGVGKTELALRTAERLRRAGLRVGGFVQRPVHDADGTRVGYNLAHVERLETTPIARRSTSPGAGQQAFCGHVFHTAAFERARGWLREDAARADVLFIDEVSKLETSGQGHAEAVRLALALPSPTLVVLCVRAEHLFAAVHGLVGEAAGEAVASLQAPADDAAELAFAARLAAAVRDPTGRRPEVGAGGVDWREVCTRMREESERQTARLSDPGFTMPQDVWAPRAARFARRARSGSSPEPTLEWLRPRLRPTDTVLDVGAGTGRYARLLSPLVARVVAVEPSPSMFAELQRTVAEERLANVELVPAPWPLHPAPTADVVLCAHVAYSIADLPAFLAALERSARRLAVLVCGLRPPNAVLAPVWEAVHGEPRRPLPGALELLNLLHQLGLPAGFEVLPRLDDAFRYESREDALRALRHRLHLLPSPRNDARLERAIDTLFVHDADGGLAIRPVPDDAALWWPSPSGR
jgi:nucleoside-triphosphatase THEP1/SAM-dependent methyltransferase